MVEILSGSFETNEQGKKTYTVSLTDTHIACVRTDLTKPESKTLALDDVIGCQLQSPKNSKCIDATLKIYAYPQMKRCGRSLSREREVMRIEFNQKSTYEENFKEGSRWQSLIRAVLRGKRFNHGEDFQDEAEIQPRRVLVLVNPFSGKGKARSLFETKVAPMFNEASIQFNMMVTAYAGHAQELVQTLDLNEFYGIVICSGDGLIFEVVNGLMQRPDWMTAIQTPLGCLPGGSGNALCCAINSCAGEPYLTNHMLHSTFLLVKHVYPQPLDLVAVDLCNGKRLYSFLAVAWGMISDVDIESERFRRLGSARFTLGALIRIVGLRYYRGTVSFLPIDPYPPPQPLVSCARSSIDMVTETTSVRLIRTAHSIDGTCSSTDNLTVDPLTQSLGTDNVMFVNEQQSSVVTRVTSVTRSLTVAGVHQVNIEITPETLTRPVGRDNGAFDSDIHSITADQIESPDPATSTNTIDTVVNAIDFTVKKDPNEDTITVTESLGKPISTLETAHKDQANSPPASTVVDKSNSAANMIVDQANSPASAVVDKSNPPASVVVVDPLAGADTSSEDVMPKLSSPVPSNWCRLSGQFVTVCAVYNSHLARDFIVDPYRPLNAGYIQLMIIHKGASRSQITQCLIDSASGDVYHGDHFEYIRVKAFRLEPAVNGILTVDGERVTYGPIQGQILPGRGHVMS